MNVVVIGAGPSGMSAAMQLKRQGHAVTVLEREDTVGGKCHSLIHGGRAYDLGANLTTPRYTLIRELGQELGMTLRKMAPRRVVEVNDPDRTLPAPLADASVLERALVRGGAALYVAFRDLTGIDRDGYAGLPAAVRQPFHVWLEHHGLAQFRDVFANLFVAYGYGVMDDLPAAYALKFFDRIHLEAAVDVILGEPVESTMDWEEGFQALWQRVDERWGLEALTGVTVTRVRRSPRGVRVWWEREGVGTEAWFDAIVIACPLDAAARFLDTSPDEDRLFSRVKYYTYHVTAARTSGLPAVSTYVRPYCQKVMPGMPTVFYRPIADDPNDVFLFYAYGDATTTEAGVRREIDRVVTRFGGEVEEFLTTVTWRYFPHVDSDTMTAGFYEEMDALQGQWRTYYVGEVLAFTLVELAARFSKGTIEKHFPVVASDRG